MSVQGLPAESAPPLLTEDEFYQKELDTFAGLETYKNEITDTAKLELEDACSFKAFTDYGDYVQWYAERWSLVSDYQNFTRFAGQFNATQMTRTIGGVAEKTVEAAKAPDAALTHFKDFVGKNLETGIHEINMNLLQLVDMGPGKISGMVFQLLNVFVAGMAEGGMLATYPKIESFINAFANPLQENPREWAHAIVHSFDAYFTATQGEAYYSRNTSWQTLRTTGAQMTPEFQIEVEDFVFGVVSENLNGANDDTPSPLDELLKAPVFAELKDNTRELTENMRDELKVVTDLKDLKSAYTVMFNLASVDGVVNEYVWQMLCDAIGVSPDLIDAAAPQIAVTTGRPGRDGSPSRIEKEIWPTRPHGVDQNSWTIATELAKGKRLFDKTESAAQTLNLVAMPAALVVGLAAAAVNPFLGIAVGGLLIAGGFGYQGYSASREQLERGTAYNAASIVTGVPLGNDEQVARFGEDFDAAILAGTLGVATSFLIPGVSGSFVKAGALGIFNGVITWASDPRQSSIDKAVKTGEYQFYNPVTDSYDVTPEQAAGIRDNAQFQVVTGLAFQVVLGGAFGFAGEGAGRGLKAVFKANLSTPGRATLRLANGSEVEVSFVAGKRPGEALVTMPDGTTTTMTLDAGVEPVAVVKKYKWSERAKAKADARAGSRGDDGVEHTILEGPDGITVVSGKKSTTGTGIFGDAATPAERDFFGVRVASHTHVEGEAPLPSPEDMAHLAATAALEKKSGSFTIDGFNAAGDDVTVTVRADYDAKTKSVRLSVDDPHGVAKEFPGEAALLPEHVARVEAEVNKASTEGDEPSLRVMASGELHAHHSFIAVGDTVYVQRDDGTFWPDPVEVMGKMKDGLGEFSTINPDPKERGRFPIYFVAPEKLMPTNPDKYFRETVMYNGKRHTVHEIRAGEAQPLGLLPTNFAYVPGESPLTFVGIKDVNLPVDLPRSVPDRPVLKPVPRVYPPTPPPEPPTVKASRPAALKPTRPKIPDLPSAGFDAVTKLKPGATLTLGREAADINIPGVSQRVSREQAVIGREPPPPGRSPEAGSFFLTNSKPSKVTITRGGEPILCPQGERVALQFGDVITLPDGTQVVFNVPHVGEKILLRQIDGIFKPGTVESILDGHVFVSVKSGSGVTIGDGLPPSEFSPVWAEAKARYDAAGQTQFFDAGKSAGDVPTSWVATPPPPDKPRAPATSSAKARPDLKTTAAVAAGGAAVTGVGIAAAGGAYYLYADNDDEQKNNLVTGRLSTGAPVYIVNEKNQVEKGWEIVTTDAATNEVVVGRFNTDTHAYETRSLHARNVATVTEFENKTPIEASVGLSDVFITAQTERHKDLKACQLSETEYDELFPTNRIQQANVGDCYLLAAFDALDNSADFELLMRKSIDIIVDDDGTKHYMVSFPLGEPAAGAPIEVTDLDLAPQALTEEERKQADTGEIDARQFLTTVDAAKGYQILEAAYIKLVTGGQNSRKKIEGGFSGKALTQMFGDHAEELKSTPAKDNGAFSKSQEATNSVTKILLEFQKGRDVLAVHSLHRRKNEAGKYIEPLEYAAIDSPNTRLYHGHAYAVADVELSADKTKVLSVELVNPWDTGERFTLPYEKFLKNFEYLSGARLR